MDDEGPAVLLLEVDCEGPEAAVRLGGVGLLRADFAQVSLVSVAHVVFFDFKLNVRCLRGKKQKIIYNKEINQLALLFACKVFLQITKYRYWNF